MLTSLEIAAAVAAELNHPGAGFSQPVAAEAKVLPIFDVSELADLHVTVVPRGLEIEAATRTANQHDRLITIGVQKKLNDLEADTPELLKLVDEIVAYLSRRPLAAADSARWVRTAVDPLYAPADMLEQRVFTSVITVTYRILE